MPTNKDWQTLVKKVGRAKRTNTIARVTQEFDAKFEMGGCVAVYDLPESDKLWSEQAQEIDYYYAEELAEYALLNIQWARR
jgi:hypothetical protein